jgi:predicted DNA binding CopG/RHH family protein
MDKTKSKIPKFKSYKEEAEFWDKHEFTEFWDEFKPIKVKFAKNLSEALSVRLDPKTLSELRKQAAKKGIGPTTLARMWILEHLEQSRTARPRSRARKAS